MRMLIDQEAKASNCGLEGVVMWGQTEDPAAATTLEWSSLLLRSFLMEAGLSIVDMEAPYMGYYLEAAAAVDATEANAGIDPTQSVEGYSLGKDFPMVMDDKSAQAIAQNINPNLPPQIQPRSQYLELIHQPQYQVPAPYQEPQQYARDLGPQLVHDANVRTQWMDPRVWSRLPEKLLERILASLPLACFFRMRVVCKRWYNLLFSDSFLEACATVSARKPWFLLFQQGQWSVALVFDPLGRAWFKLDLACVLPPGFNVVASSGGLLCCMSEARGCKTVLICNPLTRACVQLPQALKERFVPTVGLVVDADSYRVLAAGDDLISPFAVKNLTTELYDSRLQQWRVTSPLPRLCNLESGKATYANGSFYCMNYSPFSVLAYDTLHGVWSKIQAPMRRFLRTPNLVECRGRLVLVAAVEKNKLNVPKSIRIWGLQQSKKSWVELERMPQALYEEFMRVSGQKAFYCIGHGNLILITLPDAPEMLLYDFYEKVWRWAPPCPFGNQGGSEGSSRVGMDDGGGGVGRGGYVAFPFDPRLEACVC